MEGILLRRGFPLALVPWARGRDDGGRILLRRPIPLTLVPSRALSSSVVASLALFTLERWRARSRLSSSSRLA